MGDGPYSFEAKYDTLAELKGMINSATRLSFQIPELTVTHFLGPDITSFNQDAHNAPLSSKQSRVTAGNAVLFILLAIFSIIIGIIFFWQRKSTQRQHVDTYNKKLITLKAICYSLFFKCVKISYVCTN